MMTLETYLSHADMSQAAFAAEVGVKQPTVHRWLNGSKPSWEAAARIERVTNGKVQIASWVSNHVSSPSVCSTDGASLKKVGPSAETFKGKQKTPVPVAASK